MNHQAIYNTHPTVVSVDDSKGAMDANGNIVTLNQSAVDTEAARLQAAQDAQAYARTRADAYPSIGDQLDMLWHAIEANATLKTRYADFHTAIKAVKDANPKP